MYIYDAEKRRAWGQTPQGRKSNVIGLWKFRGVAGDLSFLYDTYYVNETNCWCCGLPFKDRRDRCLDHSHITGEFRQILCQKCNRNDSWRKFSIVV